MRLSVLDQSPISEGSTGAEALRNTIDLARHVDGLGYNRYWVAEHHGTSMLAGSSPEALIGPIAAATSSLRIGSGGVMLPYYNPLKVAETFSVLSGLFPGRIDLGVGRAPGSDRETMLALQRDRSRPLPDDFPEQLAELLALIGDHFPAGHPLARHAALPGLPASPEPWLLGSSPQSAIWAAELGLGYAFADFINPDGAEWAALYRQRYAGETPPQVIATVSTICAETDAEAERLAASGRMAIVQLRQGRPGPVPAVERALRFLASAGPPSDGRWGGRRTVVGAPQAVRAGLEAVAEEYGADELMLVTITHDHDARRRSYELVAEAFR
jgi:luciferase family oxidoreductase group 1